MTSTFPASAATSLVFTSANRECAICGKNLEDAASVECGVGPICRKIANEVLAHYIPADLTAAAPIVQELSGLVASLPEVVRPTLTTVLEDVAAGATTDWRSTVKRLAWVASWGVNAAFRGLVVGLVSALGYVGYAGLLTQEASTGKARVYFDAGRLYLEGPRNKAGREAFKAEVQGYKFHPAAQGGEDAKAAWSAPVSSAAAFFHVVSKYWPLATGHDAADEQAAVWLAEHPTPPPASKPAAPSGPVTRVESFGADWIAITSPYNVAFVGELKNLPYKARKWEPASKRWLVAAAYKAEVVALLTKHYGAPPVVTA